MRLSNQSSIYYLLGVKIFGGYYNDREWHTQKNEHIATLLNNKTKIDNTVAFSWQVASPGLHYNSYIAALYDRAVRVWDGHVFLSVRFD